MAEEIHGSTPLIPEPATGHDPEIVSFTSIPTTQLHGNSTGESKNVFPSST